MILVYHKRNQTLKILESMHIPSYIATFGSLIKEDLNACLTFTKLLCSVFFITCQNLVPCFYTFVAKIDPKLLTYILVIF